MLTGFLARYAVACFNADHSDVRTMANVRAILVPALRQHQQALVQALRWDRRSSRPVPIEVRRMLVGQAHECRRAIRAAVGVAG